MCVSYVVHAVMDLFSSCCHFFSSSSSSLPFVAPNDCWWLSASFSWPLYGWMMWFNAATHTAQFWSVGEGRGRPECERTECPFLWLAEAVLAQSANVIDARRSGNLMPKVTQLLEWTLNGHVRHNPNDVLVVALVMAGQLWCSWSDNNTNTRDYLPSLGLLPDSSSSFHDEEKST